MIKRVLERPALIFAAVLFWKIVLLIVSAQPVPSNDAFFYDGPVVNFLLHGKYANPSLALALPISGNEVFCAYPPLYQFVLLGWLSIFGVSAVAAMFFHLFLFALFMFLLLKIFRHLNLTRWPASIAGTFLLVITFHDRPDSLAHVLGTAAIYCWIRSRTSLDPGGKRMPLNEITRFESQNRDFSSSSSPPQEERVGERRSGVSTLEKSLKFRSIFPMSWRSGGWTWAAAGFVVLALASGLQIGALYFLLIWIGMLLNALVAKENFPLAPMMALVLLPIGLLALVVFGFPHLWTGFLEHAHQTPALTGWRLPRIAEILKTVRTVPGILMVVALMPFWLQRRDKVRAAGKQALWLVTLTCALAAFAVVAASLFVLTPNSVFFAGYLQPLILGCFLGMFPFVMERPVEAQGLTDHSERALLDGPARFAFWAFLGIAAVGSIRAIGMSTWGLACAADVSYAAAIDRVSAELRACPRQSATVLSSAYLYEAALHDNVRCFHSDWLAPARRGGSNMDLEALIALKPSKILLTQFDYFRRFETVFAQLKQRQEIARFELVNFARTPTPDSFPSLQKVVQHISWAPVVVSLSWQ